MFLAWIGEWAYNRCIIEMENAMKYYVIMYANHGDNIIRWHELEAVNEKEAAANFWDTKGSAYQDIYMIISIMEQ